MSWMSILLSVLKQKMQESFLIESLLSIIIHLYTCYLIHSLTVTIIRLEGDFPDAKKVLMSIYVAPRGMSEEEIVEITKVSKEVWAKMGPCIFEFFIRSPYWNFASPYFKEV